MIEINGKEEQIEIKEYLTFSGTVQSVYDEFVEAAKIDFEVEADNCEEANEKLKKFIDHQLTHEDKIEILEYIGERFDRMSNYYDNASIFDQETVLVPAVQDWITDTFDIGVVL